MPSKSKLKRDARKTERIAAQKANKTTPNGTNGTADSAAASDEETDLQENGDVAVNGDANSVAGSEASKKAAGDSKETTSAKTSAKSNAEMAKLTKNLAREMEEMDINAQYRNVTGVLDSHVRSRDIKVSSFSITFHGAEILLDTKLELNSGRRYGLVGLNGAGKSTLLSVLGRREIPIPKHIDIYHLHREMPPSDKTALQAVLDVDEERVRLEKQAEELMHYDDDESHETLMDIYARLDEMNADTAEARAASVLCGLGFTAKMMQDQVKNFSGGWRMRIALARLLFLRPSMMLLDEPTNHLDLDACVWLEEELKTYNRILVVISHSQDFMNTVCTNIIHLTKKQLLYYGGNYDAYVRTQAELHENQMKRHNWEQDQISHMKDYIARFGHGSRKLARQAQSKEKTLAKMVAGGLTEKVQRDKNVAFYFPDPGEVPPPVIMVQNMSFRYSAEKPYIYKNIDQGIDLDTRVALVGPNGAGKSTLLKLITGELNPTEGMIRRHPHVRIGRFHQHLHEILDLDASAVGWMMKQYPDIKDPEEMRKIVGRFGLTGRQQVCPMRQLSDGQRSRVIFSWLANQAPHILALDEPTNHLDMETIDALADALNEFEGGILLVSHDFRLIDQVAEEIWACEKQGVTKYEGNIKEYKEILRKRVSKIRKQELKKVTTEKK